MKKIIVLLVALLLLVLACEREKGKSSEHSLATSVSDVSYDVPEFSYDETLKAYSTEGDGVRLKGFKNTEKLLISSAPEAIARAKNECRESYNSTSVYYDSRAGVWNVCFFNKHVPRDCFDVYLTDTGITTLIVTSK